MSEKMLEIENLKVRFESMDDAVQAIRGVGFSVEKGEVLGIVGESGSGKSVTVKALMGILPASAKIEANVIDFKDRSLLKMNEKEKRSIRGNEMAMIFQDPMTALNPLKTIGFHLTEAIMRHRDVSKKEAKEIAIQHLSEVGIPSPKERLNQYPFEFSGGMRQRVLIAMALSCNPDLLIADEPTTALDVTIQAQILELLQDLQKEKGMSIILITHDLGIVAGMCQRIIVMYGGLIMEEGTTEQIFYHPQHPYTKALLKSLPSAQTDSKRLEPIPGNAPKLVSDPVGCPFASRCQEVMDRCFVETPEPVLLPDGQRVVCLKASAKSEVNHI